MVRVCPESWIELVAFLISHASDWNGFTGIKRSTAKQKLQT